MKNPYTYPARSRAAMVAYLSEHESYGGWNHPFRRWSPLSWNVKFGRTNNDGKRGEYKTTPELDEKWDAYIESNSELWNWIVEDMQRQYTESEYTTYPGNDQGQWKFCFAGRSGGHMLLESWECPGVDVDFIRGFHTDEDWQEWLSEISFPTLKALYRAVCCMDQDFTREKIDRNFEYQLNYRRNDWEETAKREASFMNNETKHTPLIKLECGCKVCKTPYDSHELLFCPTHKTAPETAAERDRLREALLLTPLDLHPGDERGECLCTQCTFRKAAKAALSAHPSPAQRVRDAAPELETPLGKEAIATRPR